MSPVGRDACARPVRGLLGPVALLVAIWTGVPSAAAQVAGEPYVVPDGAGDVSLDLPGPTPLPALPAHPLPATDPVDLLEIRIDGEDEVGLEFAVKLADLQANPLVVLPFNSDEAQYGIHFALQGTDVTYTLAWRLQLFYALPGQSERRGVHGVRTEFCLVSGEGGDNRFPEGCKNQQASEGTVDWDQNVLRAYVTKDALMGQDPADDGYGFEDPAIPRLTRGMRLSDLYATTVQGFPSSVRDRAPDSGFAPEYAFKELAANTKVRLGRDEGAKATRNESEPGIPPGGGGGGGIPLPPNEPRPGDEVAVSPGEPTLVPLRIVNNNAGKRLLNLTARPVDPDVATNWKLKIARSVQVPGGDSRVVNLIVEAAPDVQHRDEIKIVVLGRSLGFPDEIAGARLTLKASAPPGPEKKTLYFHAASDPDSQDPISICGPFPCSADVITWLNTLRADSPRADLDQGARIGEGNSFEEDQIVFRHRFILDTPLAHDVLMDATVPVEAKLDFKTDVEFPADVSMTAETTKTRKEIGHAAPKSVTIKTGTPVALSFLANPAANRISVTDERIAVEIVVQTPLAGVGLAATSFPSLPAGTSGFLFVPAQSEIAFPFIPDPNATRVSLANGPALITLASRNPGLIEYVNPGKTKLLNATVTNEGIDPDEAVLEVTASDPAWAVSIRPGLRFQLAPGDNAKFAVLVRAPAGAQEGDSVSLLVNASSANNPAAYSQLRYTVIAITSQEIDDEAGFYERDADNDAKVVTRKSNDTPGFGLALAFAALAALLQAARRRRR